MCEEDFTMKKYRVNVNGTVYEVELAEITGENKMEISTIDRQGQTRF